MKTRMVAGHAAAGQAASGGGGTLWTAWIAIAFIISICCVMGVAYVAFAMNHASVLFDSSDGRRLVVDHDVVIVGAGLSGAGEAQHTPHDSTWSGKRHCYSSMA
jgi:hypothetical protein